MKFLKKEKKGKKEKQNNNKQLITPSVSLVSIFGFVVVDLLTGSYYLHGN